MALFRFLFAPALLAAAVLAGHGERRRPQVPVPAAARPLESGPGASAPRLTPRRDAPPHLGKRPR